MQSWTARGKVTQTSLFVVTLVTGIASILVSKWLDSLFLLFGIAIPMILMLVYAGVNRRDNFLDSTRSQVADNCYFLGFLYFLASLSITLVQVSSGIGTDRIEPIIRGFGIALVTTITGLFLRILLLQNIAGLSSAREKAEEGLLAAVNRFHEQVTFSVDLLAQARDQIMNSARETSEMTNATLRSVADNARQSTEVSTAAYVEALAVTAEKTGLDLASIINDLRTKVTSLALPTDALTSQLQPALDGLRELVTRLNTDVTGLTVGVAETATQVRKIAPRLEKSVGTIAEQAQVLEAALTKLSAQAGAVGDLGIRLSATVDGVRLLTAEIDKTLATLRAAPGATQGAVDAIAQASAAAGQLRQAIGAVASTLQEDFGAVGASLRQARAGAEALAAETRNATTAVGASVRALGSDVEAVRQGLNRTIT